MKRFIGNNRGLSFVEIFISMAILLLVISGFASQMFGFQKDVVDLKKRQISASIGHSIKGLLESQKNCLVNFQGLRIHPVQGIEIPSLHFAMRDPTNPLQFIKEPEAEYEVDVELFGFVIKRIQAQNFIKIGNSEQRYIAEVDYELVEIAANKTYRPTPAVMVFVTDNTRRVIDCVTPDEATVSERKCEIDGTFGLYDPVADRCIARIEGEWFLGTQAEASCPSGWLHFPGHSYETCSAQAPPGYSDTYETIYRPFPTGTSSRWEALPYLIRKTETGCSCTYATDISTTDGWQCQIKCFTY